MEALAQHLGIPLTVLDLQAEFAREVLDYFVSEYARGRTPNPCVRCNAAIKFGRLWDYLKSGGFTHLATGHYARLDLDDHGAPGLFRGVDRRKDQSYFLSRLPQSLLPNLLFPLGQMTKEEVRRIARRGGIAGPGRPAGESMELCFIPSGGYQDFLQARRGCSGPPGDFVDAGGRLLGRHRGLENYTVGQRRGLGIPAREPFYVIDLQPEANRVVLGHRQELLSPGLTASQMNWLITPPAGEIEAVAVIRYRHPGVRARITPGGDGEVTGRLCHAPVRRGPGPGRGLLRRRPAPGRRLDRGADEMRIAGEGPGTASPCPPPAPPSQPFMGIGGEGLGEGCQGPSAPGPLSQIMAKYPYALPFRIITFGCKVNQCDTAGMARELTLRGWRAAAPGEIPDLVVVNTCTVTARADQQARQTVRRLAREYPETPLWVTGCYAQRASAEVAALPGVQAVFGNQEKGRLAQLLSDYHGQTALKADPPSPLMGEGRGGGEAGDSAALRAWPAFGGAATLGGGFYS